MLCPLLCFDCRIMAEEHGYQRSAKKCKEKLDNLYKYYKKTKVAKGGCQDGKHYRFFKQLEALYGGNNQMPNCLQVITSTSTPIHQPQESLESKEEEEFDDTISSEEEEEEEGFEIYDGWNVKLRGLIETQMRRLMEVQESWLGKTLHAVERMEQERVYREEAWRRKELARSEQEERLWACEKAWIEARGAALVNALQRIGCKCRYAKKVRTLLMTQDAKESTSMYGYDGDNNRKKEIKESEAVLTLDSDEIAEMIRLQGWVQPELDKDQYHGSGLAQLR